MWEELDAPPRPDIATTVGPAGKPSPAGDRELSSHFARSVGAVEHYAHSRERAPLLFHRGQDA
jgi:hypothetical protein